MASNFFLKFIKSRNLSDQELDPVSQLILYFLKRHNQLDSTELAVLINKKMKKEIRTNTIRRKLLKLKELGYVDSYFDRTLKKTVYHLSQKR